MKISPSYTTWTIITPNFLLEVLLKSWWLHLRFPCQYVNQVINSIILKRIILRKYFNVQLRHSFSRYLHMYNEGDGDPPEVGHMNKVLVRSLHLRFEFGFRIGKKEKENKKKKERQQWRFVVWSLTSISHFEMQNQCRYRQCLPHRCFRVASLSCWISPSAHNTSTPILNQNKKR